MTPETSYRTIPLTKGQVALVSAEDFDRLNQRKWHSFWSPKMRSFYAIRHISTAPRPHRKRRVIWMHREILGLAPGDKRHGDHIESGQTLDNRRSNLRIATDEENMRNRRTNRTSKSGLKGAWFQKSHKKWTSQICFEGKKLFLGLYDTAEQAHLAYRDAATRLYGEFARFN